MFRVKLSVFYAMVMGLLMLSACSTAVVDRTLGMTPNAIYEEAKEEMANIQWDKAIILLEKLEGRASGTLLSQQASLDKAYAQYKTGEPAQAISTLERFIKLNPASPALDYALYLKGVVTFNENLGFFSSISRQDLSERDPKASKESFAYFKELVDRFPDSQYAEDARQRMNYIVRSLAQYEVHVARYYFKRGAYVSAIGRAQTAISDFRDVPAIEEAIYILYKSYDALGMVQLRDDALRVLSSTYPRSEFLLNGGKKNTDPWWKMW
jgi:outer membrane protein assembly factor BamD